MPTKTSGKPRRLITRWASPSRDGGWRQDGVEPADDPRAADAARELREGPVDEVQRQEPRHQQQGHHRHERSRHDRVRPLQTRARACAPADGSPASSPRGCPIAPPTITDAQRRARPGSWGRGRGAPRAARPSRPGHDPHDQARAGRSPAARRPGGSRRSTEKHHQHDEDRVEPRHARVSSHAAREASRRSPRWASWTVEAALITGGTTGLGLGDRAGVPARGRARGDHGPRRGARRAGRGRALAPSRRRVGSSGPTPPTPPRSRPRWRRRSRCWAASTSW